MNVTNAMRLLLGTVALLVSVALARPAAAQFSAREGFAADGTSHFSFELTPYLFLPNIHATIGLNHPPGADLTITQGRSTVVSKLSASLTGAFVGYGLMRYGDWSADLNVFYVSGETKNSFAPLLPNRNGFTIKNTTSLTLISPGFGYQVLPTDASSKVALDAQVGFSYNEMSASSSFSDGQFYRKFSTSPNFVQPWIGARLSYYPTPDWRITVNAAVTGLGVDGGAVGWNARAAVSYLVTNWFDVTLGYAALETRRNASAGPQGENRNVDFLAYGPVVAMGFRF
jgi:hypothetical protein